MRVRLLFFGYCFHKENLPDDENQFILITVTVLLFGISNSALHQVLRILFRAKYERSSKK